MGAPGSTCPPDHSEKWSLQFQGSLQLPIYLSLKTIWSNICRQWNCFKAFCWYLGCTFPHNHSDQTWSQSCWKALLPFLREPEVDIPTKVFNYLYEFGLRPIRPFIIYIYIKIEFGNRTCNFVPWCAILLFLNPTCWWLQIYIYSVYACFCMHVQFSGNLYVFSISYIYMITYVYVNIYKHLPLYRYVHLKLEIIYPKDPRIASNGKKCSRALFSTLFAKNQVFWKQSCFFQSKGLAGTGDELQVEHVGYSEVLVGRIVTNGLCNIRSSLHSGNNILKGSSLGYS